MEINVIKIGNISAITETTIAVTFKGQAEPKQVTLDTPLVDGATTVTFSYNEQTFTDVKLEKPYINSVEKAIADFEAVTISTYNDVATAEKLKNTAEEAIKTVEDETTQNTFMERFNTKVEAINTVLNTKVKAINDAGNNQINLVEALNFFNDMNTEYLVDYDKTLDGTQKTVKEIQSIIYEINTVKDVNKATNQLALLSVLKNYQDKGILKNVRDEYIVTYANGIIGKNLNTIESIQAIINGGSDKVVGDAKSAVVASEAAPQDVDLLNTAKTAISEVPADILDTEGNSYKTLFEARITNVEKVKVVLDAQDVSIIQLLNTLKSNGFESVKDDFISEYNTKLTDEVKTIDGIQKAIDTVNAKKAISALFTDSTKAKLVEDVNQAKIDEIKTLVTALEEKEIDVTQFKTDLQTAQGLLDTANNASTELTNAIKAAETAKADYLAAGGKEDATEYTAVDTALKADPQVAANITTAAEALVNATNKLVELTNATKAAETAKADYLTAGGKEDATEYTAVDTALKANPQVATDITTATQTLVNATNELVTVANINVAIEAKDIASLQSIIVNLNIDEYNNLTSAQRVELTEYIINNTTETVTSTADFKTAIFTDENNGYVAKYLAIIKDVNTANTITAMKDALDIVDYDVYNELTSVKKLDVAEKILATVKAEGFNQYSTLSQIKAAIDEASK